ncbi:L-threonylcarbamoyladenylate synthase [Pancytospora epiphaga]|nr:L-threonylcarbamoyladenylate synthase [Pancytospora epiphaga]
MRIVKLGDIKENFRESDYNTPFVIPTETVYGLAARIDNEDALRKIYEIKGRPSDNPLIIHISSESMLESLVEGDYPKEYRILMERFWPGPLTLLFRAKSPVSPFLYGRNNIIAVRMPKHSELRNLIEMIGVPLAAPSANTSGRPSPTLLSHVIDDLGKKVNFYVDGGPCEIGLESTVFGILEGKPVLFRPGGISKESIESALQSQVAVKTTVSGNEAVVCPGQKYRHYSPSIPVYLFKGESSTEHMRGKADEFPNKRIGLMAPSDIRSEFPIHVYFDIGSSPPEWSRSIFTGLRELDKTCDIIFVLEIPIENEGLAIMDRLEKAATHIIN